MAGILILFPFIIILILAHVNDDHIISIRILCKKKKSGLNYQFGSNLPVQLGSDALKVKLEIQLNDITVEVSFHLQECFGVQV